MLLIQLCFAIGVVVFFIAKISPRYRVPLAALYMIVWLGLLYVGSANRRILHEGGITTTATVDQIVCAGSRLETLHYQFYAQGRPYEGKAYVRRGTPCDMYREGAETRITYARDDPGLNIMGERPGNDNWVFLLGFFVGTGVLVAGNAMEAKRKAAKRVTASR